MSVYDVIKQLESVSSRNEKLRVLEEHKDNKLLKKIFEYAYNPEIVWNIKDIPDIATPNENNIDLEKAIDYLYESLHVNSIRGNAAKELVKSVLEALSKEDSEIVSRMLRKDLRVGMNIKTIAKVWKEFLAFEFPVMLCASYSEKNFQNIRFPAIAQEKADGVRCIIVVKKNSVVAYSRKGQQIDITGTPLEFAMQSCKEGIYDGELLVIDDNEQILPRKIGNGIVNKAIKGTVSQNEKNRFVFCAWDWIPENDYFNRRCNIPYEERLKILDNYLVRTKHVKMIETRIVNDLNEAKSFYNEVLSRGGEGIIVKNVDGIWEAKRVKHQVKMKLEKDVDLRIVDVIEGTGKNAGALGALVLETDDGKLRVSVGTGFSDEQRKEFWNKKNELIGKICTIKGNGIIDAKNKDKASIFLPVFVELREDKDISNTFEEVKEVFNVG